MKYQLQRPFEIAPSLNPGIRIGDRWLTLDLDTGEFVIIGGRKDIEVKGYRAGIARKRLQDMFGDILSFLSAWAENLNFEARNPGMKTDGRDMFERNAGLMQWARAHSEDFEILREEVEGEVTLITTEG